MGLTIDRVSKHFGPMAAVDGVVLKIPEGQIVGIIGRSGADHGTYLI